MNTDEQQIRELVSQWMQATRRKDPDAVLALMTDDAKFLVAGRPPFGKAEFEKAARAHAAPGEPDVDGEAQVEEVAVSGDMAYAVTVLKVAMGGPAREGRTLTVYRKVGGRWLLARDANLLPPPQA